MKTESRPRPLGSAEEVVLIHGLAATRRMMRNLEHHLHAEGYTVNNWGYRSLFRSIQTQAQSFAKFLEYVDRRVGDAKFHIVGHSMGCIVTRMALQTQGFERLGRVVMLAPPNAGSPVARELSRWLGWICPPLHELSDAPSSLVNQLPPPTGVSIGIIAAGRDRVVPLASTILPNHLGHITLPGRHKLLPLREDTAVHVAQFLRGGSFVASTLPCEGERNMAASAQ